jgi:aminoglycoside phosphotransferase (APT) family kinase protein
MISKTNAEKAIKKVFPDSKIKTILRLKKGMINENYSIKIKNPNKELILRMYPQEGWKAEKEKYLYNLISSKIKIPVPTVHSIDTSKKILKKNYLLLSRIPGVEMNTAYKRSGNVNLIKEAGSILAKLHSIKLPSYGWIVNTKISPKFSSWKDFIFYDLGKKLAKLSKITSIKKAFINKSLQYIEDNKNLLKISSEPCLLHKDYHSSHIFANSKKITGIIDIEWAIAGHNEMDLIKSCWWMSDECNDIEKPFLQGYKKYGTISKKFSKRRKLYELTLLIGLIGLSYERKHKKWFNYNLKKAKNIIK